MAVVTIPSFKKKSLQPTKTSTQTDTNINKYVDLHLDMKFAAQVKTDELNRSVQQKDLVTDKNLSAIANSLTNLFMARPGQRPLYPEFGLNLAQYLGEPVNNTTAALIGQLIYTGIKKYESRVTLVNVNVQPIYADNMFEIVLTIKLPTLGGEAVTLLTQLTDSNLDFYQLR